MATQTIPDPPAPCTGVNSPRLQIRHVVEDIKSEALEKFIAELMSELLTQGFSFAFVLNALATWSYGQVSDEVVKTLEELAGLVTQDSHQVSKTKMPVAQRVNLTFQPHVNSARREK